uniref:Uncharacterized protein n=1 Tax=Oryza glumipatula TaxID=40148 RepID=A0A0D9YFM4_9ORYZ
MASRDGNGGGLGGFRAAAPGAQATDFGRLAQANSAPELHQARRGGRSLTVATKHSQISLRHVSGQATCCQFFLMHYRSS